MARFTAHGRCFKSDRIFPTSGFLPPAWGRSAVSKEGTLRSRTERRRVTEVAVAVHVLNRMLELGRPEYIRLALTTNEVALTASAWRSMQQSAA